MLISLTRDEDVTGAEPEQLIKRLLAFVTDIDIYQESTYCFFSTANGTGRVLNLTKGDLRITKDGYETSNGTAKSIEFVF